MRCPLLLLIGLLSIGALAGCGNKGALYLPEPETPANAEARQ